MITRRDFLKIGGVAASSFFLPKPNLANAEYPKRVFYIADQGIDPDDALDAWKLGVHARRRNIQIVGAASSVNSGYSAPVLKIILKNYFGLTDIPFGKYVGNAVFGYGQTDCWGHGLATAFGGDAESDPSYTNSSDLLNNVLANSPDNSVYILSTGPLSVEAEALANPGAKDLWAAKVAGHYPVAGQFPNSGGDFSAGWNLNIAPEAARYFIQHTPDTMPIIWTGLELVPGGTAETIWAGPPDTPDDTVSPLKWIWHNACYNHIGQTTDPLPDNNGSGNGGMRWMWTAPAIEEIVNPGLRTSRSALGYVDFTEAQATNFYAAPRPTRGDQINQYLISTISYTAWKTLLVDDMAQTGPFGALPQSLLHSGGAIFTIPSGKTLKVQ